MLLINLFFVVYSYLFAFGGIPFQQKQFLSIWRTVRQDTLFDETKLQEGDIVFQTSSSAQCKAVQLATHSKYSHCGIVFKQKGQYVVYEAVQPVKITPIQKWIAKGKNKHFVVKRLKNADQTLTVKVLEQMKQIGNNYLGKNYDLYFGWSDDKIYCSELVWKIYNQTTGLAIGTTRKLTDFDLSSPEVQKLMKERYGNSIPVNETVIAPSDIFDSSLLVQIW